MVSEDNVVEISRVLVNYALKSYPEFCDEILGSILSTCSRNLYEIVVDFDWYVGLLGEMSRILHFHEGEEIEKQLVDIGMRVKDARPELVRVARSLLIDPALLGNLSVHRILSAAAWVSGEYIEFSRSPFELVEALVQPRTDMLPSSIRAAYLQSVFKVLIFTVSSNAMDHEDTPVRNDPDTSVDERDNSLGSGCSSLVKNSSRQGSMINLLDLVESSVTPLLGSLEVDVLERVRNIVGLIEMVRRRNELPIQKQNGELIPLKLINALNDAFSEELRPVLLNAQERIPIPDALMLKENLKELDAVLGDNKLLPLSSFSCGSSFHDERSYASPSNSQINSDMEATTESTSLLSEHRKRHDLYYLLSERSTPGANDYPPANDPKSEEADTSGDAEDDLMVLAAQSLGSKKKCSNAKPRPLVKLDERDVVPFLQKKLELKDNLLFDAEREILYASDSVKGKENATTYTVGESKENSHDAGYSQHAKSSSRKGKHRKHHHKDGVHQVWAIRN
ncbi:hypothetical protein MLD38_021775 [Melastoma candidum]|uniref:Uncharacterized protein n=1 Tax=Melastoma candidum TaxID=119954 RepID=A0ACB9QH93_9MYRT|nr:hypothetical protein MLD38_021775 [Melastoma candidum]